MYLTCDIIRYNGLETSKAARLCSYYSCSFLIASVQQKLMLHNRSHPTALNCHGQKYAIFESVDGDKKEPTDGAT